MKFAALATALIALPCAFAQTSTPVSVSFDQTYDNPVGSLDIVACSDGPNGLESKGFSNFTSLPGFPNIGGAFAVEGFDSANCGTCWALTFNGTTINVLAIDTAPDGFNIALAAMNKLTNNQAQFLGRINATARMVGQLDACEEGSRTSGAGQV
ncbi:Cerato-platanin-domain-containing protein [Polyporus arcularius HHB13444]|uniref:Cerato-platanin-domain-containing protein n=1 Tax=Polyporus arcularius HHB13444 TaxID=1314778 RepID=A0A5C3P724_9APHY|nr:Cerato-platanin-domain-containing protein [Polyporus arcularius HHB13444]